MNVVYLWKFSPRDAQFSFIPFEDLPYCGYQSLYGIPEEEADKLREAGSYAGYHGICYPSPYLYIDCDGDHADQIENVLVALELSFKRVSTGNRGAHFYVDRMAVPSADLPRIERNWVQRTFGTLVDLSIYKPLHPIRRLGHLHESTKKQCTVTATFEGRPLDLSNEVIEPETFSIKKAPSSTAGLDIFQEKLFLTPYYDGNRTRTFYYLSRILFENGFSFDEALEQMLHTNSLGDPLHEKKLTSLVESAYKK